MATQTSGDLQLSKPAASDLVKNFRTPYNSNMDTIDTAVTALNSNLKEFNDAYGPVDGTSKNWIASADLNTMKTSGLYPIGSSPTNAPAVGGWGILEVSAPRQDTVEQTYRIFGTSKYFYFREYRNNTWTDWERLVLYSQIESKQLSYTLKTQTKYTISTNYAYRTGNVVIVQLDVTCNTPESTSPGEAIINGLPGPKNNFYLTIAPRLDVSADTIRATILTDGTLYLRYGATNTIYDVLFTYVTV